MPNLDITQDANLTTNTTPDLTNDRIPFVDAGTATLQDIAPRTLLPNLSIGSAQNYSIAVSVASNNITVALKDAAGADPTPASPVKVQIGTVTVFITSALSVTVNAAVNSFNAGSAELATQLINYFVYLGYRASDASTFIGFARIPYGRTYADFSNTATNEKYLAASGAALASTDSLVNIGRFSATLSAGAGYTWSISGTGNVFNFPIYETDWLNYVPVWASSGTAVSLGNATIQGRYKIAYNSLKLIFFQSMGGTTTFGTGTYTWTAPFSAVTYSNGQWQSSAQAFDSSPTTFFVTFLRILSGASIMHMVTNSGIVAQTVPFTWASGDIANGGTLEYQIA